MPFTPESVGLTGERITAVFREPRPNGCPHKGLDISSSRTPKPFAAGVFGRVAAPIGGEWGTITIVPFNNPGARIQYLHCSSIAVSPGDIVAPWSVIGNTGETAPPGSGITGIHLHIQVEAPGAGGEACWNNRNFVDPQTWPTPDLMAGIWVRRTSGRQGEVSWVATATHRISGSGIDSAIRTELHETFTRDDGCVWTTDYHWASDRIINYVGNSATVNSPAGSCTGSTACGTTLHCTALAGQWKTFLKSIDTLQFGEQECIRSGLFTPFEIPVEAHEHEPTDRPTIAVLGRPDADIPDLDSLRALMLNKSPMMFYGGADYEGCKG